MKKEIYKRQPLSYKEDIPVFSETNEYIRNYERISHDHVVEMEKTGKNPFMNEEYWQELEHSTEQLILKYSEMASGRGESLKILMLALG